ncbi:hypothetical protein H0X06_00890 [Candidatus Dependentiae bacterium]|nr:hypothetical protein [Candidatus Dependentiae bacterium]
MKTLLKKQIFALALVCVPSAFTHTMTQANPDKVDEVAPTKPTPPTDPRRVQDYTSPIELMEDFLDVTRKPNQPLQYWANQFILIFHKEAKLREFCKELAKAVPYKNANRISQLFLFYKKNFSPELTAHLQTKGLPFIRNVFEVRAKK